MPRQHDQASDALALWNDPSTRWERATFDGGRTWREFARTPSGGTVFRDDVGERQRLTQMLEDHRGFRRNFNIARAVGIGVPAAAFAAPAIAGTFGASSAAAAAPAATSAATSAGTAAATGAGGMTFGNLLKLGELGAGLFTNIRGNSIQNRALDRDSMARSNEFAQQMAMLREQNAQGQRQWDAEQAQRAQEFALAQEDRTRRMRLEDEREARLAPRRAMAEQARLRLVDLLRLGRG